MRAHRRVTVAPNPEIEGLQNQMLRRIWPNLECLPSGQKPNSTPLSGKQLERLAETALRMQLTFGHHQRSRILLGTKACCNDRPTAPSSAERIPKQRAKNWVSFRNRRSPRHGHQQSPAAGRRSTSSWLAPHRRASAADCDCPALAKLQQTELVVQQVPSRY